MRRIAEIARGAGYLAVLHTWETWRDGESDAPVWVLVRIFGAIRTFHESSSPHDRLEVIAEYPIYLALANWSDLLDKYGTEAIPRAVQFLNEMSLEERGETHYLISYLTDWPFHIKF